ncbi:MAG: c-type cytochrome [Spirochaetia bacterium]|nr:c-type cytochrome [Spirochaetia bacterium]
MKTNLLLHIILSTFVLFFVNCKPAENTDSSKTGSQSAKYKPAKLPEAPSEYQKKKNPFEGNEQAIAKGKITFEKKCKKCHGEKGDGKGEKADVLGYKPIAFSEPGYLKTRSDGQLFFIIENGSPDTDMDAYGKGTSTNLDEEKIWEIISYFRKEFTK